MIICSPKIKYLEQPERLSEMLGQRLALLHNVDYGFVDLAAVVLATSTLTSFGELGR